MRRLATPPRKDWRKSLSEYPYGSAASPAALHWQEDAAYEFSAEEIDRIEAAADEVHGLIRGTLRTLIEGRLLPLLAYESKTANVISAAWASASGRNRIDPRQDGLFGRLDFAYDGGDSLKLIGANYDGPAGLFAASVVQWQWKEAKQPEADQFNGLHEGLVERLQTLVQGLRGRDQLHLTCATPDSALEGELAYLAAVAEEAGLSTTILPLQEIGWDGRAFLDLDNQPIRWLLKLYPWEALLADPFGLHLDRAGIDILDPPWRIPASNHGLLASLWERYPQHPHLTPASLSSADLPPGVPVIERSLLGLDRPATRLVDGGTVVADTGPAENPGGTVFLAAPPLFSSGKTRAVLQCWLVGDKCLGLSVRESTDPLVGADSTVVPHFFR